MLKKYFTEEEIYLIIKMYRQGFDIDDIIKQFKSEESNIREVLKFYQIDFYVNLCYTNFILS